MFGRTGWRLRTRFRDVRLRAGLVTRAIAVTAADLLLADVAFELRAGAPAATRAVRDALAAAWGPAAPGLAGEGAAPGELARGLADAVRGGWLVLEAISRPLVPLLDDPEAPTQPAPPRQPT